MNHTASLSVSDFPQIVDVRFIPVYVPLARPMRTASGTMPGSALGIFEIDTDAGITGTSYVVAYTPRMLRALATLSDDIKDIAIGQPAEPRDIFAVFQATFRLLGIQGLLGMAIAGIDMALWDALGKLQEKPVSALLGAEPRPLKAYDSFGFVEPAEDAEMLERSLARGFLGMKIKLGVAAFEDDLRSVAGVRKIIGPDVALMVDYNQSLTPATALERITRLQEFDIYWLEEPVPAEDLAGHRTVSDASEVAVQTGENWWFPSAAKNAIDARASRYVMQDIMKIGGFTGWMAAAAMAATAGLPVSSHAFVEASAHALTATTGAHWLEYLDKATPLLTQGYSVENGCVTARGPGLGIEWNAAKIAPYRF